MVKVIKSSRRTARHRAALLFVIPVLAAGAFGGLTRTLAAGSVSLPRYFAGLLNDYTPTSVNGVAINGAPYEMHGKWTLQLDEARATATFAAEMTMATADFVNADPNDDPGKLGAHTHHITMTDATVLRTVSGCPSSISPKPLTTTAFVVKGMAHVTGNGQPAPFEVPKGITEPTPSELIPSPLTICITGGTLVRYSNITLQLGAPASSHFGPQAIHGVIVKCGVDAEPSGAPAPECTPDL